VIHTEDADVVGRALPAKPDLGVGTRTGRRRIYPACRPRLSADATVPLSELPAQGSYSYVLANIYVGAQGEAELIEKYQRCVRALPFHIDDQEVPSA
jgi:hypothetical protein